MTRTTAELIGERDVHIWWFELTSSHAGATLVTADEQAHASRFAVPQDAARFLAGRSRLRQVCEAYGASAVERDERGRPYVVGAPVACSLAHSGALIVVAVGRRAVGVDVELPAQRTPDDSVIRATCSPLQRRRLAQTPSHLRADAFVRYWVRKEALCKALGSGLELSVSGVPLSVRRSADGDLRTWRVRDLEAPNGYRAAVAASGINWRPTIRTFARS